MSPTTFVASCTYTRPDGGVATGQVTFFSANDREENTATIQDQALAVAHLDNTGSIAQTLVVNAGGYWVVEEIVGRTQPIKYRISGTADIDLSTVDADTGAYVPPARTEGSWLVAVDLDDPGSDIETVLATFGPFTITGVYLASDGIVRHRLTCTQDDSLVNDFGGSAGNGTAAFQFAGDFVDLGLSTLVAANDYDYEGPYSGIFSALAADFATWITGSLTTAVVGGNTALPKVVWAGKVSAAFS